MTTLIKAAEETKLQADSHLILRSVDNNICLVYQHDRLSERSKSKLSKILLTNQLTCLEGLSLVHMEENWSFGIEINIAGSCILLLANLEDISW